MQQLRFIASSLAVAALNACNFSRPTALEYQVARSAKDPGQIQIVLRVHNVPSGQVALRGYGPASHMRVTDLEVSDANGQPVQHEARFMDATRRSRTLEVPRYTIPHASQGDLIIKYSVRPGKQEGPDPDEPSDTVYSYLDNEKGFLRGRHLFLLPENRDRIGRIEVRFDAGLGPRVITPWIRKAGSYRPDLSHSHRAPEALVTATIGIGNYETTSMRLNSTEFEFVLPPGIDRTEAARDLNRMTSIVRYVHSLDPDAFGRHYQVVLAPVLPSGTELAGEGWLLGQSGSFYPSDLLRLRSFARNLLDVIVRHRDSPLGNAPNSMLWLQDGAAEYYSWKSLVNSGLVTQDAVSSYSRLVFVQHQSTPGAAIDLESAYDEGPPSLFVRSIVAPLVYEQVAAKVQAHAKVPSDPHYLLHSLSYNDRALDPSFFHDEMPADVANHVRESLVKTRSVQILDAAQVPIRPRRNRDLPCGPGASKFAIIYTGNTQGYLENCGCKLNDAGGIARRATALARIRAEIPSLLVDAGNWVPAPLPSGRTLDLLGREEVRAYERFMSGQNYDLVFASINELALFGDDLMGGMSPQVPTVSPIRLGHARGESVPPRLVRVNGLSIAAFGFVDEAATPAQPTFFLATDDAALNSPKALMDNLERHLKSLPENVDLVVLGGNLHPVLVRAIANTFPRIDLIVSTEQDLSAFRSTDAPDPEYVTGDDDGFVDRTLVLYPSLSKYGVNYVTVTVDSSDRRICGAQYEGILLDKSIPEDRATRMELEAFYRTMEQRLGGEGSIQGNGEEEGPEGAVFVGADKCEACHEGQFAQWKQTPHATAYKTLLDKHRHFHPRCVGCHVLGYGRRRGFELVRPRMEFANVQCESCHGPGSKHVADPTSRTMSRDVPESVCLKCHDSAHSDDFNYARKLARVIHSEGQEVQVRDPGKQSEQAASGPGGAAVGSFGFD